jgi:hypothetical protein
VVRYTGGMNDNETSPRATVAREEKRAEVAAWMHGFLVGRGAWFGCRDWDGLDPNVRDAFTDMAALLETVTYAPAEAED